MDSIAPVAPGINPYTDIAARDWLAEKLFSEEFPTVSNPLLLLGDGPFNSRELASFLTRWEIDPYLKDGTNDKEADDVWRVVTSLHPPVIVLGHRSFLSLAFASLFLDDCCLPKPASNSPLVSFGHWIERIEDGSGHVYFNRSKSLARVRCISQEMLLACLLTGRGVEEELGGVWVEHASNHLGLRMLPKMRELAKEKGLGPSFRWPTTVAALGHGSLDKDEWPQIGFFSYLGYKVGADGEDHSSRKEILSQAFSTTRIPRLESEAYMLSWGSSESVARLKKMAESIASFCRNAKRRDPIAMNAAIRDWEMDLAWLKRTYFDNRFDGKFPWPKTDSK